METVKIGRRGLIKGHIIYLEEDAGMPDGQPVTVILEPRPLSDEDEGRQRMLNAAGGWAGDDEEGLNEFLQWYRRERKVPWREIEE